MFDAHIQYYAYNNTKHDDFGVGYIGNKEFWVGIINRWNRNDNLATKKVTLEDWDELDCETDFRGCQLAEITPDEDGYTVYVVYGEGAEATDETYRISKDYKIIFDENLKDANGKSPSVPRWVSKLKNQLRDA